MLDPFFHIYGIDNKQGLEAYNARLMLTCETF